MVPISDKLLPGVSEGLEPGQLLLFFVDPKTDGDTILAHKWALQLLCASNLEIVDWTELEDIYSNGLSSKFELKDLREDAVHRQVLIAVFVTRTSPPATSLELILTEVADRSFYYLTGGKYWVSLQCGKIRGPIIDPDVPRALLLPHVKEKRDHTFEHDATKLFEK